MRRHIVARRFRADVADFEKQGLYARLAALRLSGLGDCFSSTGILDELPLMRGFDDVFWFDRRDAATRCLADGEHKLIGADNLAKRDGGAEGVCAFDPEL